MTLEVYYRGTNQELKLQRSIRSERNNKNKTAKLNSNQGEYGKKN